MKLRMLVGCLSISCLGLVACEESEPAGEQPAAEAPAAQPAGEPAKPAVEPAKPVEVSPTDACNQLAAAAKANDEAKVTSMLAPGGAEAMAGEGVKEATMAGWAQTTCGDAKVEGDKAMVVVTMADAKKPDEATFVKGADGWKFDLASWTAKHPAEKGKKGKKAKKAKGKKSKS